MQRRAISLLAFAVLVTSVVAGATFHLCGMEGLARTACCCHESSDGPPAQLKRIDDCCGTPLSQEAHPIATSAHAQDSADAPTPLLAVGVLPFHFIEDAQGTLAAPIARGSPGSRGSAPLFIWHCSYLN